MHCCKAKDILRVRTISFADLSSRITSVGQEPRNLIIDSPYPRTVALMGGDLRPKPKPFGVRLAADIWTVFIGFSYSLLSLLTHWSVIVILVIAFAWRAFRVERMKVDFAPRTIALALLAWVPLGLITKLNNYEPGPEVSPAQWAFFTIDGKAILSALIGLTSLLVLWGGTAVWRRMTRVELAPGGFYEGWRSGLSWFLLPAMLFHYAESIGLLEPLNVLVVFGGILSVIIIASILLWRTIAERTASGLAGAILFGLSVTSSSYRHVVQVGWDSTAAVDGTAVLTLLLVASLLFGFISYRNKKNPPAEPMTQFISDSEEK